ncbi:MAG TPA: HEAT repeat domain-containing protein [Thermoanaerobaculia bacterium]|nr:HEAT repeat domain-containing protein [Thermoanaerobaculia bacterium]
MTTDAGFVLLARSPDADTRQQAATRLSELDPADELSFALEMLGDRDWRVRKTVVDTLVERGSEQVVRELLGSLRDSANAGKRNSATEALIRIGPDVIPFVIFELGRESDIDVRLALVNLLGDLRDDDAFATLLDLMTRERDQNVVSAIVSAIGKYRSPAAVEPLMRMVPTSDLWLRFHVVEALGEIGDRSALPALIPLFADKALRKPVLEAIGKIGDPGTVSFLLKVISEDNKLNLGALRALVRISEVERPRVLQSSCENAIRRGFQDVFPAPELESLIEQLRATPKRDVKNFILKLLGWSRDLRALPAIAEYLDEPESSEVAAQALVDLGPESAPALLETLRRSDDDDQTLVLMRVAGIVGGLEVVPSMLGLIDHENPSIRRAAIEILGETVDPRTIDYLLAKLDDVDIATQLAAVDSICKLIEAFPEIEVATIRKIRTLLKSTSIPVRLNSLSILVNVEGEGFPDEVLLASKNQDAQIRAKAVSLMSRFPEERFANEVVLALADEDAQVRLAAIQSLIILRPRQALQPLLSSLEDSDLWIRAAAAQALGSYPEAEALEALIRHTRSDGVPVRIAAVESLGRSGTSTAIPYLMEGLTDHDVEIRRASILALSSIEGEDVFGHLLEALEDADWRLRATGAESLGRRGDSRALPELHRLLLNDEDVYVQKTVVGALGLMGDRSSFPHLVKALRKREIQDAVTELLLRRKDLYGDLLEKAWKTADRQDEMVLAAILQASQPPVHGARDSSLPAEEATEPG